MTNNFRQLLEQYRIILSILIFTINAVFTQIAFSESLSSSEDIEVRDYLLVDESQAEDFINQLSSYDHIAIKQLSDTEAQALLEDNYQLIDYSADLTGKLFTDLVCATGAAATMPYVTAQSISTAVQTTAKHNVSLAVLSAPAAALFGCMYGLSVGMAMGVVFEAVSYFNDLLVNDKD